MSAEYTCVNCWTMYDTQDEADFCCACEGCIKKDRRIAELEAQLEAVRLLPEKWCVDSEIQFTQDWDNGHNIGQQQCAKELKAALNGDES